jgi:hypothetical protein
MKKHKLLIIAVGLVFIVFLIYWTYNNRPTHGWKEYKSLVRMWPRLQNEKIESITFCKVDFERLRAEDESFWQEMNATFSYRIRDANEVRLWPVIFDVPKKKLPELATIIDKAMKGVNPNWWHSSTMAWSERMLIVTDRGEYIVHDIDIHVTKLGSSYVRGQEWKSYELGEYLKKYGFPASDVNKPR